MSTNFLVNQHERQSVIAKLIFFQLQIHDEFDVNENSLRFQNN